jgi:DNA adenine methylase
MISTIQPCPALKWPGNKFNTPVAKRVKELFAPLASTHTWIEPFVGAGGMLLEIDPPKSLCFDLSAEVVGLHRWIQNGGRYVEALAAEHTIEQYYERRLQFQGLQAEYNASPDTVDADEFFSLLLWLNKAGFNGLWRVNGSGAFNVPVGRDSDGEPNYPVIPNLEALSAAYRRSWGFYQGDFQAASDHLIRCQQGWVYCDPPYFGTHSAYTAQKFTWDDQKRLAHWAASLGCPVAASNSNHPDVVALYEGLGFEIEFIKVKRSIAANVALRGKAVEMLAIKGVNHG